MPPRPRYTSLLLLWTLLTAPSRANLGETVQQCVVRYGTPVGFTEATAKNPFGTVVFKAGGYVLLVFVLNDKEVGARVSKADQSAFTETERQTILTADETQTKWTPTKSDDPTCLAWSRSDNATALYDQTKHMIIFTSPEMARALSSAPAPPPPPTAKN